MRDAICQITRSCTRKESWRINRLRRIARCASPFQLGCCAPPPLVHPLDLSAPGFGPGLSARRPRQATELEERRMAYFAEEKERKMRLRADKEAGELRAVRRRVGHAGPGWAGGSGIRAG